MNKKFMIFSIVGVSVTILPLGAIPGLVLSINGLCGGSKQLAQARADPEHVGIGIAHTAKWLGLGGVIQNGIGMLYWLLVLIAVIAE